MEHSVKKIERIVQQLNLPLTVLYSNYPGHVGLRNMFTEVQQELPVEMVEQTLQSYSLLGILRRDLL